MHLSNLLNRKSEILGFQTYLRTDWKNGLIFYLKLVDVQDTKERSECYYVWHLSGKRCIARAE